MSDELLKVNQSAQLSKTLTGDRGEVVSNLLSYTKDIEYTSFQSGKIRLVSGDVWLPSLSSDENSMLMLLMSVPIDDVTNVFSIKTEDDTSYLNTVLFSYQGQYLSFEVSNLNSDPIDVQYVLVTSTESFESVGS